MRTEPSYKEVSNVTAIQTLSNVVGLYAVTEDGVLGVYGQGKEFIPDRELTEALGAQLRQLLASHRADPHDDKHRLGVIYRASEKRPWGSDTFLIEKSVVREVYPVSGPPTRELTAFQKKNREKSIYRALELLIEYRYERLPDEPVYCPLLFDGGTFLQNYQPETEGGPGAPIPVIEVLNLMPMIPLGHRKEPAVAKLMSRMHELIVHKDMRRAGVFTLTERDYVARDQAPSTAEFFDADKRHEREQTLAVGIRERLLTAQQMQQVDRFDQVEQWLERPHRPADAALLRTFTQFRDLDNDRLALLAEKALIYTAPGGARLLNIGMKDAWNMYLLEGTVTLEAADGGTLLVTGGGEKAASPVSFLKPRKYTVTSVTSVSFLWIHDALLEAVLTPSGPQMRVVSALKPSRS